MNNKVLKHMQCVNPGMCVGHVATFESTVWALDEPTVWIVHVQGPSRHELTNATIATHATTFAESG